MNRFIEFVKSLFNALDNIEILGIPFFVFVAISAVSLMIVNFLKGSKG